MAEAENKNQQGEPETDEQETKGTQSDPQDQGTPSGASGEASQKTYTESELNAMMAARLAKQEKALKSTWEKEQQEARRKAEMSAEEKAAEARKEADEAIAKAQQQVQEANRRVALAGKVKDVDYAIYKASQGGDFVGEDGSIDVDRFLKQFPDQVIAQQGPAPIKGGGKGPADKQNMDQVIRDMISNRR